MTDDANVARPGALLGLAGTVVLAGAVLGALTNAVNGAVSPAYFVAVLGWEDVQDVGRAAIAQGIFEGLMWGVAFAIAFTLVVGIVSRAACPYRVAVRYLAAVVLAGFGAWLLGGLLALGLAALSPEFFRMNFRDVPEDSGEMLRYAWVGGSIQGAILGGVIASIVTLIVFSVRWRRRRAAAETPDGTAAAG